MITERVVEDLRRIVGKEHVLEGRAGTELYAYDASLARGQPGVVVFPAGTREAAAIVRRVNRAGVACVPRGFGTNLSGGTVLTEGIIVCLSRLNRILGIYPRSRHAVVQPGVTNLELQNALAPMNFFYAPDPASQKVSTLGGNIGENSGGPRCLKYGVTTNHVLGLEMILPDGEIIRIGEAALDPPGYDLRGVVIGSEGTYGIVTEITVRILPAHEHIITMLAVYDELDDAARSVSAVIGAGIVPTTLEMMDAPIIAAVEDSYACGYPRDAAAVLIIEVEGPAAGLDHQARRIRELCTRHGCREINEARDDTERNRLWEGRRGAFGAVARLAPSYLVNDCSVSRTRLPEALSRVTAISEKYAIPHGNVFHAGDGNLHPLLLFDSRDAAQMKRVKKAGWEIMEACCELGGTISGEHGIGVEKQDAMHMIFSREDLDFQLGVKQAFDPGNLLNPGKVIPASKPDERARAILSRTRGNQVDAGVLVQKVRAAGKDGQALSPAGFGSRQAYGNLLSDASILLKGPELEKIVAYDPPNQVVTAGAGLSLAALQAKLQANNQWLPLRPPMATRAHSLGGLAATAACGPERILYGGLRDLMLGLRFVSGQGQVITAGGRVVKNVAGYDITRLMVGSAGTLGMITEMTLKVATLPERCCAVSGRGTLKVLAQAATAVIASNLWPAYVVAVPAESDRSGLPTENWEISIGLEGIARSVESQLEKTNRILSKHSIPSPEVQDCDPIAGRFADQYASLADFDYLMRVDVPLDRLLDLYALAQPILPVHHAFLDFGNGRMWAGLEKLTHAGWLALIDLAVEKAGHAVIEAAPDEFRRDNDVFGRPRLEWAVMHRLKNILDPGKVFAPGRLPGRV